MPLWNSLVRVAEPVATGEAVEEEEEAKAAAPMVAVARAAEVAARSAICSQGGSERAISCLYTQPGGRWFEPCGAYALPPSADVQRFPAFVTAARRVPFVLMATATQLSDGDDCVHELPPSPVT